MPNELEIDIDVDGATRKLAGLKAELQQLIEQAKELKSVLADTHGQNRQMTQQALGSIVGRIGNLQSQIGGMSGGGVTTSHSSPDIGALGQGPLAGAFGVSNVSPGLGQGTFAGDGVPGGGGGYTALMRAGGTQTGGYQPLMAVQMDSRGNFSLPPNPPPPQVPMLPGGTPAPGGGWYPYSLVGTGAANNIPNMMPQLGNSQYMTLRAQQAMYGGLAYQALGFGASQIEMSTQLQTQGGSVGTVQTQAGNWGRLVGGVIGGLAGAVFGGGPYGIGFGMLGGSQLGGSIAENYTARFTDKMTANNVQGALTGAMGFTSRYTSSLNWDPMTGFGGPTEVPANRPAFLSPSLRTTRFSRYAAGLNAQLGLADSTFHTDQRELAEGWANISGGLMGGGINPFQSSQMSPDRSAQGVTWLTKMGAPGKFIDKLIFGGIGATLHDAGLPFQEQLGETYMRRLKEIYRDPDTFKDMSKRLAPVFSSLPSMGSDLSGGGANVADVLSKFGPELTSDWLRLQNDQLKAAASPEKLMEFTGLSARNKRLGALGSLQPTGAAFAASGADLLQMQNILTLPGGRDSLAFSEAYGRYREHRAGAFEADTLSGFGLRDLQLQGQQRRQEYMPFAPGNIFATSLGIIANNRGQIGRLDGMLSNKDLSETERYGYESQRQGLLTENARNVGMLSEGFENRLPALAAGRPDFFSRYNSLQGAAINLGRIGSPIRAYGAGNGGQAAAQARFVTGLGGDSIPGASMPYSRTGDMNATNDILNKILAAITANNGGGRVGSGRPMDARNGTAASQSGKTMPDPNYHPN